MTIDTMTTEIAENVTDCQYKLEEAAATKLLFIEVYVCITTFLLVFLVIFGSFRRRFHSPLLTFTIWAAYVLSTFLITYTTGMMHSLSYSNEMLAVWAVFLVIFFGSADSISVYSLEDNEARKRFNWDLIVKIFWISWLIYLHGLGTFKLPLQILLILIAIKTDERARAMMLASRSHGLKRNPKLVADFMGYEHELSKQDEVDPTCMKGYNYLVLGEKDSVVKVMPPLYQKQLEITEDVITVQKIWQCKGWLLSSRGDPDGRLKDICLSFALFKLLCRRFTNYPLHESSQEKTLNFVRHGLLSKEGDHERAFRVIEQELVFLYDLFYTKYAVIFRQKFPKYRIAEVMIVALGCYITVYIMSHHHSPARGLSLLTPGGHNMDFRVTAIVIFAILFMEVLQLLFIVLSGWAKVMFLCKYVQRPSWQDNRCIEKMIRIVCHIQFSKPWDRELGQYSLLQSFDHNHCRLVYNSLTASYIDTPRKGQKQSARIKLPVEVKKAVILSLKINGRRLTNGIASLERNGVDNEFSWACRLKTQIHVILVWHIATSLCEKTVSQTISSTGNASQKNESDHHFTAATSLSKYCAYLVAFSPRFLPEHPYNTEFIFDQVVLEARNILKGYGSWNSRFEKLMTLGEGDHEQTIVKWGARLGKDLIVGVKDQELRWKILADFWAEMMLFVSPSDDSTVHAEHLAKGGEFVTHLWALLTHAGIIKQDNSTMQDV